MIYAVVFGGFLYQPDNRFYCRTVKEILLRIIVSRRCDNDKVCVLVCGCAVCCGLEIELACAFLGLAQEFLNIVVFNRRFEVVDLLDLLRNDIDCGDIIVLG